ncbi:MAG: transporter substrate-binding domain-containing protein [Gemmatimonadaceae bacterium]
MERASAILAFALVAAAPSRTSARETIDIAVEDAAAPWSQADGTGYANDVARAAFAVAGVDVRMHVMPYARCKQLVVKGEMVACVTMSPAPELVGVVRFSARPLFEFACDFFERTGQPVHQKPETLEPGTRIGTVLGYEYPPEVLELARRRKLIFDPAPTEETNLRKLAAGRLDMAVVNRDAVKSADWVAGRAGVTGKVRSAFRIGALPGYIGFSLAHPSGPALARRFDAGLERLIASGERDRIQQRWIAGNARPAGT